jgi:hypothetical protein
MTELANLYKLAYQCQQVNLTQAVERLQGQIADKVNLKVGDRK